MKSTPATARAGSSVMVIAGAGAPGDVLGEIDDVLGRVQFGGPGQPNVAAHQRAHDQQRAAHVEPAVPDEGVGDLVIGLVTGFVHGEEVGEHLGGMPFVGQPVVHRHPGVGGELLDVGLGVAAELDRVVHPAQHGGGVGDRFLVAELGAGRVEVGDVRALIVGADLERGPGAGRGLLEDQRDLLAGEPLDLGAGVLGQLERLGQLEQEAQLARLEVDLLEEAAVLQVERHDCALRSAQNAGSRSIGQVMQWPPPRPLPSSNPSMVITSMPALRSAVLVPVLRS